MPEQYPLPSSNPEALGFALKPLEHLDRLIREHIEEGRYPGAQIALARNGQLALFRTYGDARTEGGRAAASDDTLFLLFSQTKVLTSAAVWTLVEEGRLSFMDKISDHLPEFAARGKGDITLHQVMTHQGGFPSGDVSRESWADHTRMRAEVCDFSLDWTPGTRLQYHPRAAHLTQAMVIEAVTGRDYRDVIRDNVLAPLGLAKRRVRRRAVRRAGALRRHLCEGAARQLARIQGGRDCRAAAASRRRAAWRRFIRCCSAGAGSAVCGCCRRGSSPMSRATTPATAATPRWPASRCIAASVRMCAARATASAASARSARRRPSGMAAPAPRIPGPTRPAACRSPT